MTHTPEQLQGMSDDALDAAFYTKFRCSFRVANDIMPLAFERELTLQRVNSGDSGYWVAGPNTFHSFADKNPLRAIACLLLLIGGD